MDLNKEPQKVLSASDIYKPDNLIIDTDISLNKNEYLSLMEKNVIGSGRIYFNEYKSKTSIINKYAKVKYLKNKIYMSMKTPSDTVSPYLPGRTHATAVCCTGKYNHAIGIAALYCPDASKLPNEFNIYFGKMNTYSLSKNKNAIWERHEEYVFPPVIKRYSLPWVGSKSTSVDDRITKYDDYCVLKCKKEDLTDGVIHFFGQNSKNINLGNTEAMVCIYEVWTDNPSITDKVFCATGIDQRIYGTKEPVVQLFSGRNWYIKTNRTTVIGHNITDDTYDELVGTYNDPEKLLDDFYRINENFELSGEFLDQAKKLLKENTYNPNYVLGNLSRICDCNVEDAYDVCVYLSKEQSATVFSGLPSGYMFVTYRYYLTVNDAIIGEQTFTCFNSSGITKIFKRLSFGGKWTKAKSISIS